MKTALCVTLLLLASMHGTKESVPARVPACPQEQENPLPALSLESNDARPVKLIDEYLKDLEAQEILSGSVLIASEGEIWFEEAYGLASREFQVPNTTATRFDVGSFNKDYTRLAIMQLVQNDMLAPGDLVGEHLPDYPSERVRKEVTIQQLIDHRSGLGDYFDEDYFKTPMNHLREIEDYLPIWGPKPLLYEPGTREEYSNYGYTVLGAIVEQLTDMRYPDYVDEFIFKPSGMKASGFFDSDGTEPNVAVGYTFYDDRGRPTKELRKNIYLEPARGGPWGKSYSTTRDLYAFFDALYAGKLLEPQFGWWGPGWNGGQFLAGGGPGLSAVLLIEGGLVVMVLTNLDEPGGEQVGMRLLEALR